FSGFVSKWLIYNAALEAGYAVPALVSWVVSVITVFYFLKATTGVFFGDESPLAEKSREASPTMIAGAAALGVGSVVLGVAPQLAVRYIINPLLPALGVKPVIGVSWLGLTAGTGSWFTTAGLILAVLAVGLGAVVYLGARRSRGPAPAPMPAAAAASRAFSGGEPLSGPARLPASDFSLIVKKGLSPFYRWADPDRYYLALWRASLKAFGLLGRINVRLEKRAVSATILAALLAGGLAAVLFAGGDNAMGRAVPSSIWPAAVCVAAAFLALILSSRRASGTRKKLPLMILSGGLALAGLLITAPIVRLFALEGAAFVALALVWKTTGERAAGRAYLAAVVISAAAMITGTLGLESGGGSFPALPLILTGFAVKLALIPLHFWLPPVAEKTPASVVGLVVAVVDVAAFGELLILRQAVPGLFAAAAPWLILAALSAFGGAALMLAQRDLKRLLAFSTIEDMGYLVLGVAVGGPLGLTGATLGAAAHALAKALLFSSLTGIEAEDEPLTLAAGGMASRFPWSGAGFVVGSLAMLGLPPTLGYAARWRLYGAAHQAGTVFMAILIAATALAVLAYARVLALYWWGPGKEEGKKREPAYLVCALVGLAVILLAFGLWPRVFTG
ncbi:MAG: proton-conducting transporter membrane subunit, partial [Acidobacteriota bacterium]